MSVREQSKKQAWQLWSTKLAFSFYFNNKLVKILITIPVKTLSSGSLFEKVYNSIHNYSTPYSLRFSSISIYISQPMVSYASLFAY